VNATRHVGLKAAEVFAAAAKELGQPEIKPIPPEQLSLAALDRSLKVLKRLKPQAKAILLKACVACVVADDWIDPTEAELLRGVAATLSIPMPPLTIDKYGTASL